MNKRVIGKLLGALLLVECLILIPPALISVHDGQFRALGAFAVTIAVSGVLGGVLFLVCRKGERAFFNKEGLLVVGLSWVVLSVIGALPFRLSGEIPHYVDALFEVVSGFTTTGASVLSNVEALSRGMLFWRSFTHWLGGMGILVFLLAIMPLGKGGYSVFLLRAESPGPSVDKLMPKTRNTAAILYGIYMALTLLCLVFLLVGGMPIFDALCTAFGTAGTGGFGIKNDSMAGYSMYIQTVCTVFMILFGINFNIYFLLILRRFRDALRNEEMWVFLGIIAVSITVITVNVLPLYGGRVGDALHDAAFSVSAVVSTTGFSTANFDLWPQLSRSILLLLMIMGGCAGSTGGGIKCARMVLMAKCVGVRVRKSLRPRSVNPVRVNGRVVEEETVRGVGTFMFAYCAIMIVSVLLISLDDLPFETNLTAVMACINNIGPGLGLVGPAGNYSVFSGFSKVVLMLNMLLGRLEIFPLLIMLSPRLWKKAG